MADKEHRQTDEILAEMEQHLSAIYEEASADIEAKAQEYFDRFKAQDEEMRKKVKSGEITEAEYIEWRRKKMLYSKRYTDMQRSLAEEISHVNETAMAYINDKLPTIYALNFNALKGAVESVVKGYSFSLVDPQVVKNLATRDKTLLPYKYVNGRKDVRWNTQKVNSAVLQGVLQGESVSDIGKRLQSVTEMNRTSAIRNARTTVTSAECKGRQDSYEQAAKDGIEIEREWIATNDMRTRHAHAFLNGKTAAVDEPFETQLQIGANLFITDRIMYPGDPEAHPANVYNCRCTVAAKVIGFNKVQVQKTMAEKQENGIETAKTNADIVDQMNKNGWFSPKSKYPASLEGADFESAMSVYRGYEKFYDRYPQMKGKFLPVVCEDLSRNQAYAQASTFGGGISVNRSRYSNVKKLAEDYAKDVRLGFHTKGTDYQSLVTHECGHGLDGYLTSVLGKKKSFSMDMRKSVLRATGSTLAEVGEGVSIYATKDNYEFFAECLAEGLWSENPRPIAKEFMKQLDEVMKGVK
jgi:SPP1 gp7 family putative phage head morphogenesis protein